MKLIDFFTKNLSPAQKQYEAVRAVAFNEGDFDEIAHRFGYTTQSLKTLIYRVKRDKQNIFPAVIRGPKKRRTSSATIKTILELRRKEKCSSKDIVQKLNDQSIDIGIRTVERILSEVGFPKLNRRSYEQRGISKKGTYLPERAESLDFSTLEPFHVDCPSAGVFFFIPYIVESGVLDIVKECKLPDSSDINVVSASLSMLLLKLIGCKRLSHIDAYNKEPGLGVFSGLGVLPKVGYMNKYSCGCSEAQLMEFQNKIISSLQKKFPDMYSSDYINLDFHSIPHFGDEAEMEKVWCGARGRTMKGANTIFAQDSESGAIIYTRADILRSEEADEVKKFVAYWKKVKGDMDETLVFDCKFTKYKVLGELEADHIKFITLRKRHKSLIEETEKIPEEKWGKAYLAIPKRKYKHVSIYESRVKLKDCEKEFRQIAIKDHGRSKPTFIVTNDSDLAIKKVLEVYAKRWRVENKLAELIAFFNLNALSSPLMIRIHFDILWTVIADTLYHRFARDLRRFEDNLAPRIFRKFVNMPGQVVYDGRDFQVKIRKRGATPVLKGAEKLQKPFSVPWLNGKTIEIVWTA